MDDKKFNLIVSERYGNCKRAKPYGKIRFCYQVNKDDPYVTEPELDKILILEEAFDAIDSGSSFREVASWLSEKLDREVGHNTLYNAYDRHRKPFTKVKRRTVKFSKETVKRRALKQEIQKKQKKLDMMEAKKANRQQVVEEQESIINSIKEEENVNPVFTPHPGPQTEFLSSLEEEILYGGAAGGGKSYALLADPMRYFHNSNFNGLLLRRTNDELRELIWKSHELYKAYEPNAKWREKEKEWRFPSGAKLWMTYLEKDEDVMRYQGQAFTWIAFDELTQYRTPFAWNYLKSRLRSTDTELPLYMRATSNPGGPGHHWVKKMFVDPSPPNKAFWARDLDTEEIMRYPEGHSKEGQPLFLRKFIPASLYDNPSLMADDRYETSLLGLTDAQKEKLLYGNWDIMEGAAFPEFSKKSHVIEPFNIPSHWRRFRACDYGYSSNSAVLWFAVKPGSGQLVVYRELYVSGLTGKALGRKIYEIEQADPVNVSYGVLDSSVWAQRGQTGPSVAEDMISEGIRWRPADRGSGSREAGFNRLHELLKEDDFTLEPSIVFFNTCRNTINQIPMLPTHPDGADDIDDKFPHDHIYDALRYGIMSRPRPNKSIAWQDSSSYRPSDNKFGY